MFEFEDSKLGRVKVINITEARSSIASIMHDKSFNYIITKNNRPVRVIINYDAYRRSQAAMQTQTSSAPSPTRPKSESHPLIKGLIETREKEIRNQGSRSIEGLIESTEYSEQVMDKVVNGNQGASDSSGVLASKIVNNVEEAESDYFSDPDLPPPQEAVEDVLESKDEGEKIEHEIEEEAMEQGIEHKVEAEGVEEEIEHEVEEEEIEQGIEDEVVEEEVVQEQVLEQAVEQKDEPTEVEAEAEKVSTGDPEKDDYFKRYRKLYETAEEPKAVAPPAPVQPKKEVAPVPAPKPPVQKSSQPKSGEPEVLEPKSSESLSPAPESPKSQSPKPKTPEKVDAGPKGSKDALSLQDLLKELEEEELS